MKQISETVLESALLYAESRLAVVPVRGKSPLTEHGVKDATCDKGIIASWWKRWPDAGVAIACGTASEGVVVLDVDKVEMLWQLEKTHGLLPRTRKVRTGRGLHYYFRSPRAIRTQQIVPGLEIRGEGSYVVAPPSLHSNGTYYEVIDDADPVALPDVLLELLTSSLVPNSKTSLGVPEISEGERNATLTSLAGTMRRRGMTRDAIEAALLVENTQRCSPSLPLSEVAKIARSVARYSPSTGANSAGTPHVGHTTDVQSLVPTHQAQERARQVESRWPEPLAAEAYYGLAGEIVQAIEPHSEADPAALLIQLLVAFGNVIGRGPFFRVERHEHHTNIFALIVGSMSKGRKGTSWFQIQDLLTRIDSVWVETRIHGGVGSGKV